MCDVCNRERPTLFVKSAFDKVGYMCCVECLSMNAEPKWIAECSVYACEDAMTQESLVRTMVFHEGEYISLREYKETEEFKKNMDKADEEYFKEVEKGHAL